MIYYVTKSGNDRNEGSKDAPFLTIGRAARLAKAGDTVRVGGGVYREWVSPENSGRPDEPVVYEAVEGELPIIKGSEIIGDWEQVDGSVYKAIIPNDIFGDHNPFDIFLDGDWMVRPQDPKIHLGDVYIDGISMFEAPDLEALYKAERRERHMHYRSWLFEAVEYIRYPERTVYQWYAEVGEKETTLWCNFADKLPSEHLIEINVRKCCFYPKKAGVNYITLRGFEICQAACPFTPPTADQPGMVGPNWSRGWIIENNHLHDAKCSAVSLGKEASTGDNLYSKYRKKPGYMNQLEAVFAGRMAGWCKERVGSHVVRNNVIHDCGQNAVVGHMGCAFSRIENNHIYDIAKKQEFFGHEIAGIKLHAAIDTVISGNLIHNCSLGIWLDWQAQGTRVSRNLFAENDRDLMIEVTHGPLTVDNNLFTSHVAFENAAQGTAFVHNLIVGAVNHYTVPKRHTPYHYPHSTDVAGYYCTTGGDDRVMNNIVLAKHPLPSEAHRFIGSNMDSYNTESEYWEKIWSYPVTNDSDKYFEVPQPVYFVGNAYYGEAKPFRAEEDAFCMSSADVELLHEGGEWTLSLTVPEEFIKTFHAPVTTKRLGKPRVVDAAYENPDATPIDFSLDYFGEKREGLVIAGPFATLCAGKNELVVWK